MPEFKQVKQSKFKRNWGWVAESPPAIGLIFSMVLLIIGGGGMLYAEYSRAPGEPSPFASKCNMWNRR